MKKLLAILVLGLMFCNIAHAEETLKQLICLTDNSTSTVKVFETKKNLWCIKGLEGKIHCIKNRKDNDEIVVVYAINPSHSEDFVSWTELIKINRYSGKFKWTITSQFKDKPVRADSMQGKCSQKGEKLF